ncbi:geranylgeranyl transferase type-2 subunit alpha-like [Varroa jacobsoni]|uniref:geranylgeranyl transferase type-2 subunit alpha-like n=1 Tax=Varroa jacobsoni TaxID=62625 RepID=UPI000BF3514A|nr:geranylgeranyl transferase type-2 subunit alpha-like [Varroa jacobsoni]
MRFNDYFNQLHVKSNKKHGRVKVKTTAQQEAEKELERQKKLALYKAATEKIFQKRASSEYDEEILQITSQILQNNPDDATLWNIRRETFEQMKAKGDDISERTKDELLLVWQALLKNPKSYGAWWHRGWVNENLTSTPDWDRELQLTGLFLEKDDRNFHCWDYRRFVSGRCQTPLEDELKFTLERIEANFSNYSSWHYRSHLLPRFFPGDKEGSIKENVLLEELDLVLNAAFTDPQDQSAWMYHRWLLGKVEPVESITFARWYPVEGVLLITFGKEVGRCEAAVKINSEVKEVQWKMVGGTHSAHVWTCQGAHFHKASTVSIDEISLTRDHLEWQALRNVKSGLLTVAKTTVLQEQLENANSLIEMEPDSKWPLLTAAMLMSALQDPVYLQKTLGLMDKLAHVDPFRKNYYRDLKSKLIIEACLEPNAVEVDLCNKGLTCLRHCHMMSATVKLNLSKNQLHDTALYQLKHCFWLTALVLDDNPLRTLDFLEVLPNLKNLSVRGCPLEDVSGLRFCTDFTEIRLSRKTRPDILTEVAKIKPKIVISMECVSPHDYGTLEELSKVAGLALARSECFIRCPLYTVHQLSDIEYSFVSQNIESCLRRSSWTYWIMALIRRSLSWRAPLSYQRGLAFLPEDSETSSAGVSKSEFRKLVLYRQKEERKVSRKTVKDSSTGDRAHQMPVNQDWPSVWPAAASFKPSVVPLPVRQGFYEKRGSPPAKHANLELMKIPNFLHLTPPAIERHCKAIKKFCTQWPEALTDARSANWITIITSDYIHSGPSIRDERARIVTVKLKLSALDLDQHARDKFLQLVGDRYNAETDELVVVTDRCPLRRQNTDYSMYVLTALFHESWVTEPWELTERQEADMPCFEFEKSRSEGYATDYASRAKNVSNETISEYGKILTLLKNEGDNIYNLDAYKKAACDLMNLKAPQPPVIS